MEDAQLGICGRIERLKACSLGGLLEVWWYLASWWHQKQFFKIMCTYYKVNVLCAHNTQKPIAHKTQEYSSHHDVAVTPAELQYFCFKSRNSNLLKQIHMADCKLHRSLKWAMIRLLHDLLKHSFSGYLGHHYLTSYEESVRILR